jgi:hypothetical protein
MAVEDDVRRLSERETIYLGWTLGWTGAGFITAWHEGRLQQANNGAWNFRSISPDGTLVAFELGIVGPRWSSSHTPAEGIVVNFVCVASSGNPQPDVGSVQLRQQLPQGVTN